MIDATILTLQYATNLILDDRITVGLIAFDTQTGNFTVEKLPYDQAFEAFFENGAAEIEALHGAITFAVKQISQSSVLEDFESDVRSLFYDKGLSLSIGKSINVAAQSVEEAAQNIVDSLVSHAHRQRIAHFLSPGPYVR